MIVLSAKNIRKEFGADTILEDVTFNVDEGDKIGIIGQNGAGKTTLLDILSGASEATGGDLFAARDLTIGYLRQSENFSSERTLIDEVTEIFRPLIDMEKKMLELSEMASRLSGEDQREVLEKYDDLSEQFKDAGGYKYQSEMRGILKSMAFDESYYDKRIDTLSGGEKTRLALAMLLLKKPNMLILDEPTNHLDIGTLKWLEQYLKSYRGTILAVSHDRYFINEMANRIFEIQGGRLTSYTGNYDAYAEKKRAAREADLRVYEKQKKEIERQEEMIRRFKGHGTEKLAKRAASREKKLAAMEIKERPDEKRDKIKIRFHEEFKSGKDVVYAEELSKSFGYGAGKKTLFENVGFDIKRGERICVVGANGIGKTTLMRIIGGEIKPSAGYIKMGHNVETAYYDQEQRQLCEENTVLDEMREAYRLYTDSEMRGYLARFLFRGDDVFLKIKDLSGGERARLSLLKVMMSGANLLLLDEPTNHLDIESKEIFEDAAMEFPGTLIIISHDRYLLSKVPTRIFELDAGGITEYLGKYDYYIEKKEGIASGSKYLETLARPEEEAGWDEGEDPAAGKKISSADERRLKKEAEAEERRQRRENERLEQEIERLEIRIHDLEEEMCTEEVLSDYMRLEALNEELEEAKERLSKYYQKWLQ